MKYLFLNFKNYEKSTGKNAIKLIKELRKIKKKGIETVFVVSTIDLKEAVKASKNKIFSQHIDEFDYGAYTGKTIIDALKKIGVKGSIINHAEHKQEEKKIKKTIKKAIEKNFTIMVCVKNIKKAEKIAKLNPDFIAIEPPELIGGKKSVSEAKPKTIKESVKKIKKINQNIKVIVGAGIKNKKDVKKAIELGAQGIFISSGVIKAKNKINALKEILSGFK